VLLVETFLALNGRMLTPGDELAEKVIEAAESDREKRDDVLADLRAWLEPRIVQLTED
jgi:prophage maintenance system killer protein